MVSFLYLGAKIYPSSNHPPLVHNQSACEFILESDDFNSKKFSRDSQDKESFTNGSSFEVLFLDDDVEYDRAVTFMLAFFKVAKTSTSFALLTPKMKFVIMNRHNAKDFIKTYQKVYC